MKFARLMYGIITTESKTERFVFCFYEKVVNLKVCLYSHSLKIERPFAL